MVWDDGMLKTLKDLDWKNDYGEGEEITKSRKERSLKDGTYPSVKIMDLREEAINWIKAINKTNFNYMKYQIVSTNIRNDIHAAILKDATKISLIKWIKQFFNITSEEEFK
jgi:hypothetical protein